MKRRLRWFNLALAVVLVSCVTVNIYFPAAAVQKAADVLVEDVRGKEQKKEPSQEQQQLQKKDKESSLFQKLKSMGLGPTAAFAQLDVNVTTPAIRTLRESLKARFPQLKPFYDRGNIGENNNGLVEVRDLSGLSLKDKSDLNRLVEQENSDRTNCYTEIMEANKFGPESLPQIQKIFANSWRSSARADWWIQKDSGEWEKKK